MPNLDNLKKQAKALVRLHRERSFHLACVARDHVPRFADMTDQQVLAADFRLADAQTLLARQHGHESWAALKAALERAAPAPVPARRHARGVAFAVPFLYVADVQRAADFYAGTLGFDITQISGRPPFYAEVKRGGAVLALRLVHGEAIDPQVRARERMLLQVSLRVDNAKAIYVEWLAAGVAIDTALQRDAFGPPFFVARDPDGNLIGVGEPGPDAPD
jgi:catechol 2,3-dioxygenase-like lactoylglutathione lyase family enzyme